MARVRAWKSSLHPRTRTQLGCLGVAVGLVLGGWLALGPLVRQRIASLAQRHGLEVDVGTVWPSLGGVTLERVHVRARARAHDAVPWLTMDLDRVTVSVGVTLAPRAAVVQGGRVALVGDLDEVLARARALGESRGRSAAEPSRGGRGIALSVTGVSVLWPGVIDAMSALEVSGLHFVRGFADEPASVGGRAEQVGVVGFEEARAHWHGASLTARGADARYRHKGERIEFSEARLEALDVEMRIAPAQTAPPAGIATRNANANAGPALPGVGGAAGDSPAQFARTAARLREQAAAWAAWAGEHLASGGNFEVRATTLALLQGSEALHVGPGRLALTPRDGGVALSFAPGPSAPTGGASLSLHASLPGTGELVVQVDGGPVTLASLGVREGNFGLVDVGRATVRAKMAVRVDASGRRLTFDGDGEIASLSLVHRALSEEPVHGLDVGWSAAGLFELDGSLLQIDDLRVALGAIVVQGSGVVVQGPDYVKVEARAQVPASECQRMFSSLPRALVPNLAGTTMTGAVSLRTGLELDTRRPDDMEVEWDLRNQCRITSVPPAIDVARFLEPFRHTIYDEHGKPLEVTTGPGTPDWVPLHAMSPFLEAAITTTEDGGFRRHGGFDKGAIKSSIRDNLRSGRFVRGASTISMQLAKNLYLERQKNLSRKLQEAILTTYLEQSLSKDEILELYFNIVEFGPMLYGIGSAADHYFDTTASELSLAQALFLTSILPAPKRTYFENNGQLSKRWLGYLHRLMKVMRSRNRISDREMFDGLSEVITLGVARSPRVRTVHDGGSDAGAWYWSAPDGP